MTEEFEWVQPSGIWAEVEAMTDAELHEWHWAKQLSGSISLPDFIKLYAQGKAKTVDGVVYLKTPGPDPAIQVLLKERVDEAAKMMKKIWDENLYGTGK